jgi:hypothetical protein
MTACLGLVPGCPGCTAAVMLHAVCLRTHAAYAQLAVCCNNSLNSVPREVSSVLIRPDCLRSSGMLRHCGCSPGLSRMRRCDLQGGVAQFLTCLTSARMGCYVFTVQQRQHQVSRTCAISNISVLYSFVSALHRTTRYARHVRRLYHVQSPC